MSAKKGKTQNGRPSDDNDISAQLESIRLSLQTAIEESEKRLETSMATHVQTINKSIQDQQKTINSLVQSTTENSDKILTNELDIAQLQTDVQGILVSNQQLKKEVSDLRKLVDIHSIRNRVTEQRLEEQTDRSTRKTIVFRGIPEKDGLEKDKKVTRESVADAVAKATLMKKEVVFKAMERVHRSGNPENKKKKGKRDVFAVFYDWNQAQEVLWKFRKNGRNSGIFIDQLFGKNTSYRRDLALQYRKELKDNGDIAKGFVAYPAKLLVKYDKDDKDEKYTMVKDFSKEEIPLEILQNNQVVDDQ